jgi:hypothetical protein
MIGLVPLVAALQAGAEVEFTGEGKAKLLAPATFQEELRVHAQATQEVLRRAGEFWRQLKVPSPSPVLTLREHRGGQGCMSCGDPVDVEIDHFRCPLCLLAVGIVMYAGKEAPLEPKRSRVRKGE